MNKVSPLHYIKSVAKGLGLVVLLASSSSALACRMQEDTRSLGSKVFASQNAFIGVVQSVSDKEVVFKVSSQEVIKLAGKMSVAPGGQNATDRIIKMPVGSTSCHHRYEVGQKWLYLGETYMSGSVLLEGTTRAKIQIKKKEDVEAKPWSVKWNKSFESCQVDADCKVFFYGCGTPLAINAKKEQELAPSWYKWKGDPRVLNCGPASGDNTRALLPPAQCISSTCQVQELVLTP